MGKESEDNKDIWNSYSNIVNQFDERKKILLKDFNFMIVQKTLMLLLQQVKNLCMQILYCKKA
jgi:hypothetical protein